MSTYLATVKCLPAYEQIVSFNKAIFLFHQFQRASNILSITAKRLLSVVHKVSRYALLSNSFHAYTPTNLQPNTSNSARKTPTASFLPQLLLSTKALSRKCLLHPTNPAPQPPKSVPSKTASPPPNRGAFFSIQSTAYTK